jgi:hypothetical protein
MATRNDMFKRRWIWFGPLISDEGFSISFSHRTVLYTDPRGTFAFGFEDGLLSPTLFQVSGDPWNSNPVELDGMIDRVIRGLRSQGTKVEIDRG